MSKKEVITVRVQEEVKYSLEKLARALGINVSDIVREATELYLKGYKDSKHIRGFIAKLYTYCKALPEDSKVTKIVWLPNKDKIIQRFEDAKINKKPIPSEIIGYKVTFYKSRVTVSLSKRIFLGVVVRRIEVTQTDDYDYTFDDYFSFNIEISEVDGKFEDYSCSKCIGKEEIEIIEQAMKQ